MSAVLQAPHLVDPSEGLELTTGLEVALEAERHIFLAADLLDPARRRDIGMVNGGEELNSNFCMRRTSGRLPRCEITPLEMWVDWMPAHLFPEGQEFRALRLKSAEVQAPAQTQGRLGLMGADLLGYPYFPGEMIVDALGGNERGIVELKTLQGVKYGNTDREFQQLFFGNFPIPVELRLIEEHIQRIAESVADPDAHSIAEDMLRSCAQSREYMFSLVDKAISQVGVRVKHEFTYSYSPKIRSYAAQLEIKLTQPFGAEVAEKVNQAVAGSGASLTPEMLAQIGTAIGESVARIMAANQAPATEAAEPTPAPASAKAKPAK